MASYLDVHPDEAECVARHRETGQFVPIVQDGELYVFANRRRAATVPLAAPLPVADYVVGLEVLGFGFTLCRLWEGADEGFLWGEPAETLPPGWDFHARRLMSAFGTGRRDEVVAFLRERTAIDTRAA